MQPIVESTLMWPAGSMSWNIDDMPRDPMALLHYALTYGTVGRLLAPEGRVCCTLDNGTPGVLVYTYEQYSAKKKQHNPRDVLIEPYDRSRKQQIYDREIKPILQEVFEAEDWGRKLDGLINSDVIEFFTNLVWCSRLRIPFVIDMRALTVGLPLNRNRLVENGALRDPRPLNELITIVECYTPAGVAFFEPKNSRIGSPLDIWYRLRDLAEFRELSSQTRTLGSYLGRAAIRRRLTFLSTSTAQAVKRNAALRAVAGVGNAAVALFAEPAVKFASAVGKRLLDVVLAERFVPPVYDLVALERQYNTTYYPDIAKLYNGKADR